MIPELDKTYETFDIKAFKVAGGEKRILTEKTMVIEEEEMSDGFIRRKFFNGSYFSLVEKFYPSGGLKEKVLSFNEGSPVGIWYKYNENGSLTEELNTEEGYEFGTEDLLEFCKEKKIPLSQGYVTSGWQTTVFKEEHEETGDAIWQITWLIQPEEAQELTIDGQTGKVIESKSFKYNNR